MWDQLTNKLLEKNNIKIPIEKHFFYNFVEDGNVYCDISTLLSSNFIEVNENSFSWNEQAEYNGVIEISTTTVTATNNGNNLIIEYSDDLDYSEYYSRTNLTDPCE